MYEYKKTFYVVKFFHKRYVEERGDGISFSKIPKFLSIHISQELRHKHADTIMCIVLNQKLCEQKRRANDTNATRRDALDV